MPFKSEKQRRWMHANHPEMAKKWEKKKKMKKETKVKSLIKKMVREMLDEIQLDEKCWKGYEKKGTKMMFGKRYPNCVKKEEKLDELTSFNVVKDKLVDLGFGNLVVSWRGTKKKVKDLKPGNRIDNITLEKTNNTLLKSKSISYDGNDYKVTPQGKKHFKGTLKLEGKLTEKEFIPTVTIEFTRENRGKGKTEVKKFKTIADAKKYTKQMNKKYKLKRQKGFWGNPVNGIELFHNFS